MGSRQMALICVAHLSTWYGFDNAEYTIDRQAIIEIAAQDVDTTNLEILEGKSYATDVELKADLATVYSAEELPLATGPVINSTIDIDPAFVLFGIFAFNAN